MSKIKDSVDLKELEKFGYLKEDELYCKKIYKTSDYTLFEVFVNIHTREIDACDGYSFSFHINDEDIKKYIDDLIQAGLVEKVEEER